MSPAATIISSGDNESHDHPRPSIISASATTGYFQLDDDDDDLVTPLVYSKELSRSIDLANPEAFEKLSSSGAVESRVTGQAFDRSRLEVTGTKKKKLKLDRTKVVGGLIYGLINVRTNGERILCATRDETQSGGWRIKSFNSRF